MGPCLRPSASKQLIYIQLINKIIAEAHKPSHNQLQMSQFQRIHKKGDIKKLIDHLSSHKYNIQLSMNYLLKLLEQPNNHEAILVIIDELVKNINNLTKNQQFKKSKSKKKNQIISNMNANNSREIQVNFQIMYFPIVLTIFDASPDLKLKVIESIMKYADIKKEKFVCEKYISQVFARLLVLINSELYIAQSVATYNVVMTKSNIYLSQNQNNHEALFLLLNLWIKLKNSEVKYHLTTLLNIYISRCMQSREFLQLFMVIFNIYDGCLFKQSLVCDMERQVLLFIDEDHLKAQFLKGLFRYLIVYLCMTPDDRVKKNWGKVVFTMSYDVLKNKHKNILNPQCKINAFTTLLRWIQLQFVDINQMASFNRQSLYSCFKFNILSQTNNFILTKILTTFVQIYSQLNDSSKSLMTQMLIQDIHYGDNIALQQLKSLIWLARKFINESPSFDDEDSPKFLKPLECIPQQRLRIQQIILMYALLINKYKHPYNYVVLQSLCQTTYSFYEILDISQCTIKQKYNLMQSVVYFMSKLSEKGYNDFILLWINGMPKSNKPNSITRYFDKLLVLEIWQMITSTKRISESMINLNKQIEKAPNADIVGEIWAYEKSHPQLKISSRLSPIQSSGQINYRYEFIKDKFGQLFKKDRMVDMSERSIQRPVLQNPNRSSAVVSQHSYKTDESFQQVYGMITSKSRKDETQFTSNFVKSLK